MGLEIKDEYGMEFSLTPLTIEADDIEKMIIVINEIIEYLDTEYNTALGVEDIIINPPATIIKWDDDTKTIVKCQNGDNYDPEKGIALCFMKKMCGNKSAYNEILKAAIKEYEDRQKKKH